MLQGSGLYDLLKDIKFVIRFKVGLYFSSRSVHIPSQRRSNTISLFGFLFIKSWPITFFEVDQTPFPCFDSDFVKDFSSFDL